MPLQMIQRLKPTSKIEYRKINSREKIRGERESETASVLLVLVICASRTAAFSGAVGRMQLVPRSASRPMSQLNHARALFATVVPPIDASHLSRGRVATKQTATKSQLLPVESIRFLLLLCRAQPSHCLQVSVRRTSDCPRTTTRSRLWLRISIVAVVDRFRTNVLSLLLSPRRRRRW